MKVKFLNLRKFFTIFGMVGAAPAAKTFTLLTSDGIKESVKSAANISDAAKTPWKELSMPGKSSPGCGRVIGACS